MARKRAAVESEVYYSVLEESVIQVYESCFPVENSAAVQTDLSSKETVTAQDNIKRMKVELEKMTFRLFFHF